MPDIQIDVSADDDEFDVVNAELDWIRISCAGFTCEVSWEQAEGLYRKLKDFFDDVESTT